MWHVLLGFQVAFGAPFPGQVSEASPHYDLEVAYADAEGLAAFEVLERRIEERLTSLTEDADLHWMKTRAMFERGELLDLDWYHLERAMLLPAIDVTKFVLEETGRRLSGHPYRGIPVLTFRRQVMQLRYRGD